MKRFQVRYMLLMAPTHVLYRDEMHIIFSRFLALLKYI
jgi:hypothetical protein